MPVAPQAFASSLRFEAPVPQLLRVSRISNSISAGVCIDDEELLLDDSKEVFSKSIRLALKLEN